MRARGTLIITAVTATLLLTAGLQAYEPVTLKAIHYKGEVKQAIVVTSEGEELMVEEVDTLPADNGTVHKIAEKYIMIEIPSADERTKLLIKIELPSTLKEAPGE